MRAKEFLTEATHQDLYHSTLLKYAIKIIKDGVIKAGNGSSSVPNTVSTTRDWRYGYENQWANDTDTVFVTFVIDQDRLRHTRKVTQYDFSYNDGGEVSRNETEELIHGDIPLKYVKGIVINAKDAKKPRVLQFIDFCRSKGIDVDIKKIHQSWKVINPKALKKSNFRPSFSPKIV